MSNISPEEFIQADYLKFEKQGGQYFVKVTTNNTLISSKFDYIAMTYPTDSSEVFTYKLGGASGTVVGTVTITYTDNSKTRVSSVAKS